MPIFYEHIKGCHKETTSTNDGNWSWIEWQKNANPKIYLETSSTKSNNGDQGNIITSNRTGQFINHEFAFKKLLTTSEGIDIPQDKYIYFHKATIGFNEDNQFVFEAGQDYDLYLSGKTIQATCNINTTAGLHVGGNPYTPNPGVIKADSKCEAQYFNATSDRRAKTNINPLKSSALSVVKSLPIYTFNYVDKPEELVVGLIAQEAAEHPLDDFNMVDNINASGKGYDLMQMKESKLVYVLWKAVQELSAEVESLKEQLNSK